MPPIVQVRQLVKSFPIDKGDLRVLNDVSLSVEKGEFVAIQGASGSGKSTLLSLMAGLDRPTAGEVFLDGQRVDDLPENDLARVRREKVGFVFQAFYLIPSLTLLENVALPLAFRQNRFDMEKALTLLDRVGLANRADFLPDRVSGGEKQRAAIARALVNDPVVVFADEPTGNLDSANGRAVLELLDENTRRAGRSLILVTHDGEVAQRADRRILIKDGAVSV